MCGGRGRRLNASTEKPLYRIAGRPIIEYVCDALVESRIETAYAAPSPHTPDTRAYLSDRSITCVETPGNGYVADLDAALEEVRQPVLTVAADLPLLSPAVINRVTLRHDGGSLTVAVPVALKDALGVSHDQSRRHRGQTLVPAGINVVSEGREETIHVSYDARVAVNVNRPGDAAVAERFLDDRTGGCS